MDLWPAYAKEASKATFGKERLRLKTGNRWHTSLAMVGDRARELEVNKAFISRYDEENRYVIVRDMTYDMFISLYDVDTSKGIFMRPTQFITDPTMRRISSEIVKARLRNIEARIIGLQGADPSLQALINKIHTTVPKAKLIELDLFGNETRHMAFDLKTGSTYDLLLQNKIYGPAELINNTQVAEFLGKKSDLAFV